MKSSDAAMMASPPQVAALPHAFRRSRTTLSNIGGRDLPRPQFTRAVSSGRLLSRNEDNSSEASDELLAGLFVPSTLSAWLPESAPFQKIADVLKANSKSSSCCSHLTCEELSLLNSLATNNDTNFYIRGAALRALEWWILNSSGSGQSSCELDNSKEEATIGALASFRLVCSRNTPLSIRKVAIRGICHLSANEALFRKLSAHGIVDVVLEMLIELSCGERSSEEQALLSGVLEAVVHLSDLPVNSPL